MEGASWLTKVSKQPQVGHDGIPVETFLCGGRHGGHVPTTCLDGECGIQM